MSDSPVYDFHAQKNAEAQMKRLADERIQKVGFRLIEGKKRLEWVAANVFGKSPAEVQDEQFKFWWTLVTS